MDISRRNVLKMGAGAAALWAMGANLKAAQSSRKIPLGLQLYSVRQVCEKDLPGVLAAVAKMGYQGVEFAGYYGYNAPQLRKLLDDNGLKCCGTHTGLDTLQGDAFKATVEFHKTLDNKFLIIPWLDEKFFASTQTCKDTAKLLTELSDKAKEQGMRVGYHAHAHDLKKVSDADTSAWDLLFSNAGPDVVMQLDTSNCLVGGGNPYAILKKYISRAATIHLKEHGGKPGAPLGEGEVRWNEIFPLCENSGVTEWYIVEHESDPKTPMESVAKCIANLRKMGK